MKYDDIVVTNIIISSLCMLLFIIVCLQKKILYDYEQHIVKLKGYKDIKKKKKV